MVEEVEELELGDKLPEGKLLESGGCEECEDVWMFRMEDVGCPYIELRARTCIKKKLLPTEGS